MRSLAAGLAVAALLPGTSGCSGGGTPAGAYSHLTDRIRAASGLSGLLVDYPCFRTINGQPGRLPDGDCYRMRPREHMRGIWIDEFEDSRFFPGATAEPRDSAARGPWLEFSRSEPLLEAPRRERPGRTVWFIDFIGRRTAVPGRYGHLGMSPEEIVVDSLLSARVIAQQDISTR